VASVGSVQYRRERIRAVTPGAIAEQLGEIRQAAAAFGIRAVAAHMEQVAREALAVARTPEESELARELLAEARRALAGRTTAR
jgi:uncharacterized membrane protein